MKQSALSLTCLLLSLFLCATASAAEKQMVFWYPGEAGSTEEAQPIIDEFLEYVSTKIATEAISGSYFNTVEDGANFIKNRRPVIGIISFAAFTQNQKILAGARPWLATLPLTHGRDHEQYTLVGCSDKMSPRPVPSGTGPRSLILTSEPMDMGFVKTYLFASIPPDAKLKPTPQMLLNLKKIAEGELNAYAILTPSEAIVMERLSAPWTKALKIIAKSKPVPTAYVVLFDTNWAGAEKLKKALLSLGTDPGAREILQELRLKGFKSG